MNKSNKNRLIHVLKEEEEKEEGNHVSKSDSVV
jgi:hypothetical protein